MTLNATFRSTRLVSRGAIFALCTLLVAAFASQAGATPITINTVPVGNVGNAGQLSGEGAGGFGPDAIVGAVNYDYRIGTHEVTNAQYTAFLNAKANVGDHLALYNANMDLATQGGITRSGAGTLLDPYVYAPKPAMANKPVNSVSWYSAIRFTNWLHNGQGSGDTETGAYTLLGGTPTPSNGLSITRNDGAIWWLPSESEWYKAAYYDPTLNGGSGGYWNYATQSNIGPALATASGMGDISNPGANVANYGQNANWNGSTIGNVTTVGSAGSSSKSFYGTLDQNGNVYEWNEALFSDLQRGMRGGSFDGSLLGLVAAGRNSNVPAATGLNVGFRVATIPEPSSLALLGLGTAAIGGYAIRRRKNS